MSWFSGNRDSRPDRFDAYPLDALADDLRALVAVQRPKGEGVALCPAVFGRLAAEGEDPCEVDGLDAGAARRRRDDLRASTFVHLDVDAGATLDAAVAMLRAWGAAGIVLPSPSAVGRGGAAERVRVLVQIAPDVPRRDGRGRRPTAASRAGRSALVALARLSLDGARVDAGPEGPVGLALVHPVTECVRCGAEHDRASHRPRPASDVVVVRGRAVDLDALAPLAVVGRVAAPYSEDGGAPSRVAPAVLLRVADAARLRMHREGRGITATECPRGDTHTDGRGLGERGDTSCAVGPWGWRCEHQHGGGGPLTTDELVDLALARVADPAARAELDALVAGGGGPTARVRDRLAATAEAVTRIVAPDVPQYMGDVGRYLRAEQARAGRAFALVRVTVGAGKSWAVPYLVDACAPDGAPGESRSPVAVVAVQNREHIADVARAVHQHAHRRRLAVVHVPVSRVVGDDGLPACVPEREAGAASRVERAGGSARSVLCDGCEHAKGCKARESTVPHDGERDRPDLDGSDLPRVLVTTHAAPHDPCAGGLLVVDEAHAAPWSAVEVADAEPAPLERAAALARWLKSDREAAAVALVCRALAAAPAELRDVPAVGRLAWAVDRVCETNAAALAADELAAQGEGASDLRAIVADALTRWAGAARGFSLRQRVKTHHGWRTWRGPRSPVAADAGEALRAVRAWLAGASVEAVRDGEAVTGSRIEWASPASEAARSWHERGGMVAALDATGDAAVAAAVLRPAAPDAAAVKVFAAALPDRRDVSRVVVTDTRGSRASQFTRRRGAEAPAVRWDRIGSQLASLLAVVRAWRGRKGVEAVTLGALARQPIARALAAFWRVGERGVDAAVDAACVDLAPDGAVTREDIARELRALLADPRALAAASDLRAEAPRAWWTYPGHPLTRGSNTLHREGVNVLASLGDFRSTPADAALRARRTGRDAADEQERRAGDVAVQWYGRARAARVEGPGALLMVHVGEIPPADWRGVEGVEVVGAAEAKASAKPETAETPDVRPRAERAVADTPAARALAALAAAGWTAGGLAARLATALGGREAASVARTLRRWRDGGEAQDAALLAAVVDLAREARPAADALRARVVYVLRGRGASRLWHGCKGAVGLRAFADRFGVDATEDDLAMFAGGADRPAVVDLLQREAVPGADVLAVLETAHGIAPPPPLTPKATAEQRARLVAEGDVEGSAWSRPDDLRRRRGVVRALDAKPPPSPPAVAPPAAAAPAEAAQPKRRRGPQ